jgi:flavin-dependent dehydrogenase
VDEFLKREIVALSPALTRRMGDVAWVEPVRTASNYSYRVDAFTGKGFLCVGDSHCFADPIFSFGVYLAMKEAAFAADAIVAYLDGATRPLDHPFAAYERLAARGQRIVQDLIDCFWEFPLAFQRMAHQTHQDDITDCFAGRIYEEDDRLSDGILTMRRLLARRLDRPARALGDHA